MSLQRLKERALQSDDVRREYDALESEFALISQLLHMRKAAGLTQEQVAVLMHTKKSNICRLEKGAVAPKVDTLQRYAKACGYELQMSFEPQAVG
ncbi:helix-turn-helix domain-containing protein [Amphritea pacifica]|uniref:Helix-turn-helix transcriptional regulator n=1 Tax=Amphritea pacifica TaxID=2811233 RepID=A0ABS2WDS4_9GAMM|nr:helix-turn-helix transcriptional regulator [Amphritea pacifica]MBN0989866.1 helix-turn-helix transcriptional regulator [Amphritea pacifica]